jgi:asparagine synthase (glutamine-hydrolysing)
LVERWRPGEALGAPQSRAWSDGARLILRRDPIGHVPLFWARTGGGICWSTHLGPLIREMGRPPLDRLGVAAFLACAYVPAPWTLVEGVRSVPPGTEVEITADGDRSSSWFDLPMRAEEAPDDALRRALRVALADAVDRGLPDGPVGAFLSGGIDSSLVVALARERHEVHTLSIHFGPPHRDELAFSGLVARHTGSQAAQVLVTPEEVVRRFDRTVAACPSPNGDPLTVPNDMLFDEARQRGLRVVLNGEGGDPCFGGPKNAPMMLSALYGERPDLARSYLSAHQRCFDDLPAMLPDGEALQDALCEAPRALLEGDSERVFLDRLMYINVLWKGGGHILPKVFGIGAAHGVTARSPLFDPAIVDLAFRLPAHTKRRGAVEKYLLKEAVRDLLPAEIVDRPKSGMMVPVEAWFDGPLRAFAAERLLDGLAPRGLVDRAWLTRLVDKDLRGLRPRRGVKIWLLLTLEAFLRVVYDGEEVRA